MRLPVSSVARCALVLALVLLGGCGTRAPSAQSAPPTASETAAVTEGVRAFLARVAHDVTEQGPPAWETHFGNSPAFFMAADGRLVFSNRAEVTTAIPKLALALPHIELHWGDDIRVDVLTPTLASVGMPFREVLTERTGQVISETGFFTGLVEFRDQRWGMRNAHWSALPATPPAVP